ncbi:MAG: transcription antitermination factor NusB [Treponema sp. GWB1_62_6]|nr:MAG: transcription antitermination factor NusB [Treponema sp. GWC1_61_84]OHE67555.1 MAG: transcription antitermination factor NusB [Treponema sp. GWB1_62_6]HCM27254.1 transcription antitermination factor NusB [Treponema sp.]
MASRRKGRIIAFQALYSWEATKPPVTDLMEFRWLDPDKRAALDEGTAMFSRALIAGVVENVDAVDAAIIKQLKNWDFSRLNRVDLAILRMSAYSLLFQDEVAPTIVIDEAVDISKEFGGDDSYRFVNGVLDAIRKSALADRGPRPVQ